MTGPLGTKLSRSWMVAPLVLGAVGILLPIGETARWLTGAYGATIRDLTCGVWWLKGSLLATAVLAGVIGVVARPKRDAAPPAALDRSARLSGTTALVICILVVATIVRLVRLDAELWLDEISTLVRYASLPFRHIVSTYDSQNQHPLYTLVARAAYLGSGGLEWSVRLPAVAFGLASLWATYAFARRVTSRGEALLATLFLSLSYHHIWFSQNARGYTAMLFFTIVTSLVFLRLMERDLARPAPLIWLYGALMALAVYTHLTAALVAVGHAVALGLVAPHLSRTRTTRILLHPMLGLVLSAVLSVCLYAVMLPQVVRKLLAPTMAGFEVEWTSPRWLLTEMLRVLGEGIPGGVFTVAVGMSVLTIGVVSYWRQSRTTTLVMLAPVVVTAAAVLAMRHNLWPRFFFFAAAFFVLFALRGGFVVARWIFRGYGDRVGVVGATAMAGLSALTVSRAWEAKQPFDAAARYIAAERAPGDAVIAVDIAAYVYMIHHSPPGWRFSSLLSSLDDAERTSRRTWVVYTFPARLRALHPALAKRLAGAPYQKVRVLPATVGGGEIHILRRDVIAP